MTSRRAEGRFSGVAPGAHIVSLRVLDERGQGSTSDVIAAIDWAVANRAAYGLRVINLSLGKPVLESWVDDPLVQAVERASRAGLVVVASAGNWGTLPDGTRVRDGITSPGNAPSAITVGAIDTMGTAARSDDRVADWSSRGLTAIDGFLKPDVSAPGRRIVSSASAQSTLAEKADAVRQRSGRASLPAPVGHQHGGGDGEWRRGARAAGEPGVEAVPGEGPAAADGRPGARTREWRRLVPVRSTSRRRCRPRASDCRICHRPRSPERRSTAAG